MKEIKAIIFDIDGTLYSFDDKKESQFRSSKFGKQIEVNCIDFFKDRFDLNSDMATTMFLDLRKRYSGEISLAVEKEFGINRSEFFNTTWNLPVENFVTQNLVLVKTLKTLTIKSGILTAAPKIWAEKVLDFLQIRTIFGEAVFTGDPDIRKPNSQAFQQLADFWELDPSQILAIGDQEKTDILPAKSLGMKTLRIALKAETEADFSAPNVVTAIKLLKKKGVI